MLGAVQQLRRIPLRREHTLAHVVRAVILGRTARRQASCTAVSIGSRIASSQAAPTETDLAFARNAASDVLTKGDKDASQPWENPETGARGSVTPLAQAYSSEGRTCRDFLASYVKGDSESWLQGAACQTGRGLWEIHTLKPWRQS